jgi:hypothetical protein
MAISTWYVSVPDESSSDLFFRLVLGASRLDREFSSRSTKRIFFAENRH